jgi:DNA-binding MurR/RpiR family transcriptional regulator
MLDVWFPECAVVMLAHDRKRTLFQNRASDPSAEDFLGSQLWRANMTSQIHVVSRTDRLAILTHEKSQVLPTYGGEIKIFIDEAGQAILFDEHKALESARKLKEAETALASQLQAEPSKTKQAQLLAAHLGVSPATVYRLKKWEKKKPAKSATEAFQWE